MDYKDFIEQHKKTICTVLACAVVVIIVVTGLIYYFTTGGSGRTDAPVVENSVPDNEQIVVHVKGGVAQPGVYTFPEGARIIDAIEAAGGVGMNEESLGDMNLAELLEDGQEVLVPGVYFAKPVNINTASVAELSLVPGMPKWLARDIVSYREEYGPYEETSDILEILGVLKSDYEAIKNYITTEDFEEGVVTPL